MTIAKPSSTILRLFLIVGAVLAGLLLVAMPAVAQPDDGEWSEPLNVSNSGSATNSMLLVDSAGGIHLLWQDRFDGFLVRSIDGSNLGPVSAVVTPFDDSTGDGRTGVYEFQALIDDEQGLHIFWLDDTGRLWHSRADLDLVDTPDSWSEPVLLGESVAGFAIEKGAGQLIGVAHISTDAGLAGSGAVFVSSSPDGGVSWEPQIELYQSTYLRASGGSSRSIDLAISPAGRMAAFWQNLGTEQLWLSETGSGGNAWSEATLIDSRADSDGRDSAGPNTPLLAFEEEVLHLAWQAGHAGSNCQVQHDIWVDSDSSAGNGQQLEYFGSCPEELRLVELPDGSLLLAAVEQSGSVMSIWSGSEWSVPEAQHALPIFTDPARFRRVQLGCLAIVATEASAGGARLHAAGCDTSSGDDTWYLERSLDGLLQRAYGAVSSVWNEIEEQLSVAGGRSINVLADGDGLIHALIVLDESDLQGDDPGVAYSRWDGSRWQPLSQVFKLPSGQRTSDGSVLLDDAGRILVALDDPATGDIYFSWAPGASAQSSFEWFGPVPLPVTGPFATSPDLTIDRAGVIYAAYAMPLNEARGVYLTSSSDEGRTWGEPEKIFDAVAAGWAMVDNPTIEVLGDGSLHLLWDQVSAPSSGEALATFYSMSRDGGRSWSDAARVAEGATWTELAAIGGVELHRFWLSSSSGSSSVWHQASRDAGLNWERSQRISQFATDIAGATVVIDGATRPHLVTLSRDADSNRLNVNHSLWTGDGWQDYESMLVAGSRSDDERAVMSAAIKPDGELAVVVGLSETIDGEGGLSLRLVSTELEMPAVRPTPLPTLTPTPRPTSTPIPTATPAPTATPYFPSEAAPSGAIPFLPGGNLGGPILGALGALLVIIFVIVTVIRTLNKRN